ncbi:putative zinc finger protein [Trichinella pseudospiralis]|uniref:Putative zinc finger protein n=1 Tax=Trichinella pseudospiralis TaxID=6337 RepID=A0A0V1IJW6_TRIPS|nr:putative zinc finger protein [Trichinella pseudospiralis]
MQTTTDYHRKRAHVILEKRAKLISALQVKSCTCMENYQGCSENVSWAIMVNGHANQTAHVPEIFLNDTQGKIDELMLNNQQLIFSFLRYMLSKDLAGGALTTNSALPVSASNMSNENLPLPPTPTAMQRNCYTCDVCKRKFISRANLRDHLNIHSGNKPFICEICGKPFKNSGAKSNHVRLHSLKKAFVCQICSRSFHWSSSLKAHLNSHVNQSGIQEFLMNILLEKEKDRHRKRKRAKPIGVIPTETNTCVDNPQGCSTNASCATMVSEHPNQTECDPDSPSNERNIGSCETMPNNPQV